MRVTKMRMDGTPTFGHPVWHCAPGQEEPRHMHGRGCLGRLVLVAVGIEQ